MPCWPHCFACCSLTFQLLDMIIFNISSAFEGQHCAGCSVWFTCLNGESWWMKRNMRAWFTHYNHYRIVRFRFECCKLQMLWKFVRKNKNNKQLRCFHRGFQLYTQPNLNLGSWAGFPIQISRHSRQLAICFLKSLVAQTTQLSFRNNTGKASMFLSQMHPTRSWKYASNSLL